MSNGTIDEWKLVKHGDRLPMMQGMALNVLAQKFPEATLELGSYEGYAAYRVTFNSKQGIYIDFGDSLELLDSVSLTKIICEKHLQEA